MHTEWFQSVSVPSEIFNHHQALHVNLFSRFQVMTKLQHSVVIPQEKTIYSLALKLLNRGIVLPTFSDTEALLRQKFNVKSFGILNSLFDYVTYDMPVSYAPTEDATIFASTIFPDIFGQSWASYIQSHVMLDLLLPDNEWQNFFGIYVDFVFTKNGKKIIILLDDISNQTQLTRVLQHYGYVVLCYKASEARCQKDKIIHDITSFTGKTNAIKPEIDCDSRFAIACKLTHQFTIALAKCLEQGIIAPETNIHVSGSTTFFSQAELQYLLAVATEELTAIIQNYASIYRMDIETNFFDTTLPSVNLCIGNGTEDFDILLRDFYVDFNFLCEIEEYSIETQPQFADKRALCFFLSYIFGYQTFRDGQLLALERFLLRKDTIVLLPTGAGKSIIYQLASYISPGLVVVVSPLSSLIEDQLSNLKERNGITCACAVTSAIKINKALVCHPIASLLYVSPERLQIPSFRDDVFNILRYNNISGVAIDEAHCVSEWGHDFRAAYLNIGKVSRQIFKKRNNIPPLLALTGTASDAVLADVQCDLSILAPDSVLLPNTLDRKELAFSVVSCKATSKTSTIAKIIRNKLPSLFDTTYERFAKRGGDDTLSGIVFTPYASPKTPTEYDADSLCIRLQEMFPEMGFGCYFSAVPALYEKELWDQTIRQHAKDFKNNQTNLIVATKAYGMGIDKNNIRFTIHDGLPMSIEQFYQEAVRAGRNRADAKCILVCSNDNDTINEGMLNPALSIDEMLGMYSQYTRNLKPEDRDDLSSLLFFHTRNFKGLEHECELLEKIIDIIAEGKPASNTSFSQNIFMESSKTKNDVEQEWINAMVRLSILGVLVDYTYDYGGHLHLHFGSLEKEDIIYHYGQYVEKNEKGKAQVETEKLKNSTLNGWEFIKFAVGVLIEYVYDKVEKSRRAALRSMFLLAKQALVQPEQERDAFIRNAILQYLEIEHAVKDDLTVITEAVGVGWAELEEMFPFHLHDTVHSLAELERSNAIKGAIGRIIESHADHPGLLLLRALTEIKSDHYEIGLVANDITASIRFALTKYQVDVNVCISFLVKVANLALSASLPLFEKTMDQIRALHLLDVVDLYDEMTTSQFVSDTNRDYAMLCFMQEKLKESL